MRKINAIYYTSRKYDDDLSKRFSDKARGENGTLFSRGNYRTKITKDMLPEGKYACVSLWYIRSFLRTTGISDMLYHPDIYTDNHFLKYDSLFVAYDGKKIEKTGGFTSSYDAVLSGTDILTFLGMVKTYGDYDVDPIISAVKEKDRICREKYGDIYEQYAGDTDTIDKYIEEAADLNKNRLGVWA